MSDILVQIRDYQGIEVAKMRVRNGLTAIIGKTNAGKSSIMRAIEDLLNNTCGDVDVRIGAEQASIAMKNNDNTVKLIRNPNNAIKTQYIINGETIEKVGRNKVEETDILGIVDTGDYQLNFIRQEDLPFLIYENGYKLYEFISQSKSKVLLNAVDSLNVRKKEVEREIKTVDAEINELKNRYQEIADELKSYPNIKLVYELGKYVDTVYDKIETMENLKKDYESDSKKVLDIMTKINYNNNIINKIEELDLNNINKIISNTSNAREKHNEYLKTEKQLKDIENEYSKIDRKIFEFNPSNIIETLSIISNSKEKKSEMDKIKIQLDEIENDISNIPNTEFNVDIDVLNAITKCRRLYNEYNSNIERLKEIDCSLVTINNSIQKDLDFLDKNKICPTCGQVIRD